MTGFSKRSIVIDGRGHLLGRLASVVAKNLLIGNRVVVVRCEQINLAGHFKRRKLLYLQFLRKRCNVNPKRGPLHYRAPREIMWRTVRGMLSYKTPRGREALTRLKSFEGCPPTYEKRKKVVVPAALKVLCIKPGRKVCLLGRLSHEVGWRHQKVVKTLEKKSRVRRRKMVIRRKVLNKVRKQAIQQVSDRTERYDKVLTQYGYK